MKKLNIIKKIMSLLCVLTITLVTLPIGSFVSAFSGVYLAISAPSNYNPTAGGTISFTLSYTGDVANISLGNGSVVLNGFTANKSISGTGNTRTLTLSNIQGAGSENSVSITGGTGISGSGALTSAVTSSKFTIKPAAPVDAVAPVLTISGPSAGSVYAGQTVTYTATYTDNVGIANISLGSGSVVLNGFTAVKSISGTGNTRTITLSNIQGAVGAKRITITGGTAIDAAGNLSNSATSVAFNLAEAPVVSADTVAPVLKIAGPNFGSIYAGQTVTYTAIYTDNVGIANISLGSGSIVLNGFTAVKSISGTGNTRTITLSNIQGSVGGSKYISITGGTAIDAAGNLANAATSAAFEIKKTATNPSATVDKQAAATPQTATNKPADWIPNPNTGK